MWQCLSSVFPSCATHGVSATDCHRCSLAKFRLAANGGTWQDFNDDASSRETRPATKLCLHGFSLASKHFAVAIDRDLKSALILGRRPSLHNAATSSRVVWKAACRGMILLRRGELWSETNALKVVCSWDDFVPMQGHDDYRTVKQAAQLKTIHPDEESGGLKTGAPARCLGLRQLWEHLRAKATCRTWGLAVGVDLCQFPGWAMQKCRYAAHTATFLQPPWHHNSMPSQPCSQSF